MKSKILLLICLILFIVSLSAVSAAEDVNQTIDDADASVSSADTLGVSLSDDEIVGSADNGTFTDLQKKIDDADDGATIELENDYTYKSSAITINKTITIDGNGYTLDGNNDSIIFGVSDSKITLSLNSTSIYVDDGILISITLNEGATGDVIVYIDDLEERLTLINNSVSLAKHNLTGGNKNVTVKYLGDNNEDEWYKLPNNVIGILVDPITGNVANSDTKNPELFYFIKGTEPKNNDNYDLDYVFLEDNSIINGENIQ